MSSIDERVVEMRFDNQQFERGVSQTLKTLDKLKEGLKFNNALNGVGLIQNAISNLKLGGISSGIDQINNKFSVLGVAGMEIVRKLTDAALSAVSKVVTAIPNQIKSGGWTRALNIENAKFQLEGLGVAWETVNKDLSYAVNGTAYGLDSAAKVAAQLTASGIKASDSVKLTADNVDDLAQSMLGVSSATARSNGDLDDMSIALRSISGVAAMTNSSYDDIGRLFTKIAGQGRVMGDDLNSLASRGLNAAATLGQALGKTESEVRDMVSKGEIDFQTFSDAMYDAFADHAVEANKTFQGALSNTKAALSKIGADVADDLLPALTEILNSVRVFFNAIRKYITPITDSLGKNIRAIGDLVSAVVDKITGKVQAVTGTVGGPINAIAGFIDTLTEKIQAFNKFLGIKSDETEDKVKKTEQTVTESATNIDELAKQVIRGDYGNGQTRIDQLRALGLCFEEIQNRVNEMLGCDHRYEVQANNTADAVKDEAKAVEDSSKTVEQSAADVKSAIATNMLTGLSNIAETIKLIFSSIASSIEAVASTFRRFSDDDILKFSEDFKQVTGSIVDNADRVAKVKQVISDVVFGIGNIIKAVGQVFQAFATALVNVLSSMKLVDPTELSGSFKNFTDNLVLSTDGVKGLTEIFQILLSPLKVIIPLIQILSKLFMDVAGVVAGANKKFLSFVGNSKVLASLKKVFEELGKAIKTVFDRVTKSKAFHKLTESAKDLKEAIGDKLTSLFDTLAEKLEGLNKIKFNGGGLDGISKVFENMADGLSKALDKITDLLNGDIDVGSFFKKLFEKIKKSISEFKFSDLFKKEDVSKGLSDVKEEITKQASTFTFDGAFSRLKASIGSAFVKDTKDALSGTEVGKQVASSGGFVSVLKQFADTIKEKVEEIPWSDIGNAIKSGLTTAFGAIADFVSSPTFQTVLDNVKEIIKLVLSLRILIKLGNMFQGIGDAGEGIGKFFKALAGKIAPVKKSKIKDLAESILMIIGALAALSVMDKLGLDTWKSLEQLAVIVGALVGVFALTQKIGNKGTGAKKFAGMVAALGFALLSVILVMKILKSFDWPEYMSILGKLVLLIASLAAAMIAINIFSGLAPVKGGTFVGFAAALVLMLIPLAIIGAMPIDWYAKALLKFDALMFSLALAMGIMSRVAGQGKVGGRAIAAMALDIFAATVALSVLSKIAWPQLLKAVGFLSATLFAISGAMVLARKNKNAAATGKAFALEVVAVALSLAVLSMIRTERLLVAAIALGGVILALGEAMKNASNNKNSAKLALAFAVDVAAVAASLYVLSGNTWNEILPAAVSMAGVMVALGLALKLAANSQGSAKLAIAFAVDVAAVAASLYFLAGKSWDDLAPAAVSMSVVIGVLAVAMSIAGGSAGVALTALAFAVTVAAVGASLYFLASMPIEGIVAAAVAIAAVIAILTAASIVAEAGAGGLLALAVAAISFGASIALAAAGIAAALLAAGAAAQMFAAAFSTIVTVLLTVIVALVPLSDQLPGLASGILQLALAGAVAGLAMIPLAAGMLAVGAASLVLAAGIAVLGAGLKAGAAGIVAFAVAFGEAAALVSGSIGSILSVIPGLGEVGEKLKGVSSDIKDGIADMADTSEIGKKIISNITNGMDSATPEIGSKLSEVKNTVQNGSASIAGASDGTGQKVKKNIVGGTEDIPMAMAGPLDETKTVIETKTSEMSDSAGTGGQGILDKFNGVFSGGNSSAAINSWLQSNDISLGEGFDLEKLKAQFGSQGILDSFNGTFSGGDSSAAINSWLQSNDISLGEGFDAAKLKALFGGEGVGDGYITGLFSKQGDVNAAASGVSQGAIDGLQSGTPSANAAGSELSTSYASGVTNSSGTVNSAVNSMVKSSTDGATNQSENMSNAGTKAGMAYIRGLAHQRPGANSGGGQLAKAAQRGADNNASGMSSSGKTAGSGYASGVGSKASDARNAGANLKNNAVSGSSGGYGGMYSAGSYAAMGFSNGISAYASVAAARAASMVRRAISAAKRAAAERSPSKKTYQIGKFFVLGMANAVSDLGYLVSNNATDMVVDAMSSMQNTIANIMDGASSNFDMSPTITPVVDLSQVGAGASTIDSMFSASQAAAISYGMAQRYQNESLVDQLSGKINDAVNAAVQRLSEVTADRPIEISVPLSLNGREIAKGTAVYMKPELDSLNQRELRKEGIR